MAKPLIMIVEDEVEYSKEIAEDVKSSGKYEAIVANSAKEALKILSKNKGLLGMSPNRVKCILLDIKMPEMDGLQFLEKIRKEYEDTIGVIIITAYEDYGKWDKALGGFAAGYIKKPYDRNDLLSKLDLFFSGGEETAHKMISDTLREGLDQMGKFEDKETHLE